VNFITQEMSFLRYFLPLIQRGNEKNISSTMYWLPCGKYTCPQKNYKTLSSLSKQFNFNLIQLKKPIKVNGPAFFIEGVGIDLIKGLKNINMTYMTDYQLLWPKYWNKIDYCIFPNKLFSQKINKQDDPKSLHYGSTKYDLRFDLDKIKNKYGLAKKNALFLYPKSEDRRRINIDEILNTLRKQGYKVFIKTRGKDPINPKRHPESPVIHDGGWFPHPSIDLLYACDLMINFDSTAVKEAAILKTPVINYHVKPENRGFYGRLNFLLNEKFVFHANKDSLEKIIKRVELINFSDHFSSLIKTKFFDRQVVCEKILSKVCAE